MSFNTEKYNSLKNAIPKNVAIIAVSKTKPTEDILEAYENGIRDFGENYVQELVEKYEALPKDIRWHFIGHLQSNKVKYIAPFVYLIHGVDSENLLIEINKQGKKVNKKINCLLQVYIAKEETKFGMDEAALNSAMSLLPELEFVNVCGLMGMASFTDNNKIIESEFNSLQQLFKVFISQQNKINLTQKNTNQQTETQILSMGMSSDYPIAIACGSNMIRVGSLIFGERK